MTVTNLIAEIQKEIFHLTSTYTVTVYEDSYADLVISSVSLLTMWRCWKANQIKQEKLRRNI